MVLKNSSSFRVPRNAAAKGDTSLPFPSEFFPPSCERGAAIIAGPTRPSHSIPEDRASDEPHGFQGLPGGELDRGPSARRARLPPSR